MSLETNSTEEFNRFSVHGLAFKPSHYPPHFMITTMFDVKEGLKVSTFSSITNCWSSRVHDVEPLLGEDCRLSGSSTYYRGRSYCVCRSLVEYRGRCLAYTRVIAEIELSV
ncbi:hypothetical protein GIB67_025274 [Kingdonia uniflora]|uniref:Uncharacterized protein n=1 Tax=Kingdonia uniflora TaxID=39325 RepID=A0A7J7NC67_9MAGN|nr:hypothetical protein GIB67_025274 [Kingdonia uniflora]